MKRGWVRRGEEGGRWDGRPTTPGLCKDIVCFAQCLSLEVILCWRKKLVDVAGESSGHAPGMGGVVFRQVSNLHTQITYGNGVRRLRHRRVFPLHERIEAGFALHRASENGRHPICNILHRRIITTLGTLSHQAGAVVRGVHFPCPAGRQQDGYFSPKHCLVPTARKLINRSVANQVGVSYVHSAEVSHLRRQQVKRTATADGCVLGTTRD